tara:strand:+ start:1481 stop:2338 length:858 start_codon:yes stop_codon:yes gene_type:complete
MSVLKLSKLTGAFGAEGAFAKFVDSLTGSDIRTVQESLNANLVVCIRNLDLNVQSLLNLSKNFGEVSETPFVETITGHPGVVRVTREADESGPLFGEGWHSDWSFQESPPSYTLLYAVETPPSGGDTIFSNQCTVFETLPKAYQKFLSGLNGVHSARRSYSKTGTFGKTSSKQSMIINSDDSAEETQLHPMVRVHPETSRKSLFINPIYTIGIDGFLESDSAPILSALYARSTQGTHTCRIRWEKGTLVIWDNRCTMHTAVNDYFGQRREMYRITITGERPISTS